ncbi:MAG: nucleotide exchange factor GrpE [Anaerolineaceae bacterium]|nr:nucleotide exchange factor GrpE [Anaerolineaceae bacterium]
MNKKANKNKQEEVEKTKKAADENVEAENNNMEVEEESKDKDEMVTIPLAEYASQLEEIDNLNQKVDEFSDGWQRERADFANYKKRIARNLEAQKISFKIDIIKNYLTIKDDLERALKNLPESLQGETWIDGIQLIYQKLSNILEREGIEPISTEGLAFDPAFHEAISHEENQDVKSGFIIEEVRKGYKIGDQVIRPSLVRVAK